MFILTFLTYVHSVHSNTKSGERKGGRGDGGRGTVTHYHNGILCTFLHSERAELCENGKQLTFYTIFTK